MKSWRNRDASVKVCKGLAKLCLGPPVHNWVLWSPFGIMHGSPGSCALGISPSCTSEALVLLLLRCCLKPGHLSSSNCINTCAKGDGVRIVEAFLICLPQVLYLSAFRILEWFPMCQNRFHLLNFAILKNMELAKEFCHF